MVIVISSWTYEHIGYVFKDNAIIGREGFLDLDNSIKQIKIRTGYTSVLNMGPSSTSGWNGEVAYKSRDTATDALFTYETYSDLLGNEPRFYNVINAGVPGYTSLQGLKYLQRLLKMSAKEGVHFDFVTLYFGDNDGRFKAVEDKVVLDGKLPSDNYGGQRVTLADYKKNVQTAIQLCRQYGSEPIVIVPLARYNWEPGIWSADNRAQCLDDLTEVTNQNLLENLTQARLHFDRGEFQKDHELDTLLPRMQKSYRNALIGISKKECAPIVDLQRQIPLTNNDNLFIDYCHPSPELNSMIAESVQNIIHKHKQKQPFRKRIRDLIKRNTIQVDKNGIPTDIYAGLS